MKRILTYSLIAYSLIAFSFTPAQAATAGPVETFEIQFMAGWNKAVHDLTDTVLSVFAPVQLSAGRAELARLQGLAADNDTAALEDALAEYAYRGDPLKGQLNMVFPPWWTVAQKAGDCDDAAWLMAAILPGDIWVILSDLAAIESSGHCVFIDRHGYVWSNFGLDGTVGVADATFAGFADVAGSYVKNWKYAVRISSAFEVLEILTPKL